MFKNTPKPNMKSPGLIGPEQTPFYVKGTNLGAPFLHILVMNKLFMSYFAYQIYEANISDILERLGIANPIRV